MGTGERGERVGVMIFSHHGWIGWHSYVAVSILLYARAEIKRRNWSGIPPRNTLMQFNNSKSLTNINLSKEGVLFFTLKRTLAREHTMSRSCAICVFLLYILRNVNEPMYGCCTSPLKILFADARGVAQGWLRYLFYCILPDIVTVDGNYDNPRSVTSLKLVQSVFGTRRNYINRIELEAAT